MEEIKTILNSKRNRVSENSDTVLNVSMYNDEKKLPSSEITGKFNQYQQYINEKDKSTKYRFNFTINSICTNVLFNRITEIVKNEGSDNTLFIKSTANLINDITGYTKYKYADSSTKVNRYDMVSDTSYSHEYCGNMEYHCGIDIFNNHYFRCSDFCFVNVKTSGTSKQYFNTLFDNYREFDGEDVVINVVSTTAKTAEHLYTTSNSINYSGINGSIEKNLMENGGWFGFNNISKLQIKNCIINNKDISINRVINNKIENSFIDLYPDRTLFSFVPKINKYRKRVEQNWDYCLTYPYSSITNNDMIYDARSGFNGLFGELSDMYHSKIQSVSGLTEGIDDKYKKIYIRTYIKNNFKEGDYVKICLLIKNGNTINSEIVTEKCKIIERGINGFYGDNYFSIYSDSLFGNLYGKENCYIVGCYVAKISDGIQCKYYIRIFKRIPNFYGSNINQNNGLTDANIDSCKLVDFNTNLSKLAFSKNIYGDNVAQINYNDDVNILGLKDNFGRELSEIFLTIVKNNQGYKQWYENDTYSSSAITYSHCFGKITSGFDMLPYTFKDDNLSGLSKSNVHRLHNIDKTNANFSATTTYFPIQDKPLEDDITIKGNNNENGMFYGDICEFDVVNMFENRLDFVYHRFNTAQREVLNNEYSSLTIDTIIQDDYQYKETITLHGETIISYGFVGNTGNFANKDGVYMNANLSPEGYYYEPHLPIKLKEYSDVVNEGYHTRMKIKKVFNFGAYIEIETYDVYYVEVGDVVYVYEDDLTKTEYLVTDINKNNLYSFRVASKTGKVITKNSLMYKPNVLKPSTAYEIGDGSGKYVWRDLLTTQEIGIDSELYNMIFTNGSNYIHKNINFYLKRQDPYGDYELLAKAPSWMQELEVTGNEKDVSNSEYFVNGETTIC